MKRLIFILVITFFTLPSGAQIKQEVIASAGGNNINGVLSISWTLGETIIPALKSGNLSLSQGIQQQSIIIKVEETLDVPVIIKIFPNPAGEVLNIVFEAPVDEEIAVTIIDLQGVLVKSDIIESASTEKQFNMQDMLPGIYFLRLTKGKLVNVYKVVKL